MERADLTVLFAELRKLCSIFGRTFDETLGMSFAETLADVPIDIIVANARAARLGDRFPLPKDLMASADAESPEVAAARAWEQTRPHFARHTEPDDPIAREVVRLLGGSASIGGKDSDEIATWVRKEFLRHYVDRMQDVKRHETVRRSLSQGEARSIGENDPAKLDAGDFRSALIETRAQGDGASVRRAVPERTRWLAPGHQVKDQRGAVVTTVGEFGGYVQSLAEATIVVEFTKANENDVREIYRKPNHGKRVSQ